MEMGFPGIFPTPGVIKGTLFRKRILKQFPFKSPDYDAVIATGGYTFSYPQGFNIDWDAPDGPELFITRSVSGGADTKNYVEVYDWTTRAYKYTFSAGIGTGEGTAAFTYQGGERYIYLRADANKIGKYDITTPGVAGTIATLAAVNIQTLDYYLDFSIMGNVMVVESRSTALGSYTRRNRFNRYDTTTDPWTRLDAVDFGAFESGLGTVVGESNECDQIPKRQGIAQIPGGYAAMFGAAYLGSGAIVPMQYTGPKLFGPSGAVIADGLMRPDLFQALLMAQGVNAVRVEAEGLVQTPTGAVYSLYVTKSRLDAGATSEGILFLEEFAQSGFDCSSAAAHHPRFDWATWCAAIPKGTGELRNPLTGVTFTLSTLLDFMVRCDVPTAVFYSSSATLTDLSGASIPGSSLISVRNANNSTFIIDILPAINTGKRRFQATGGVGAWVQNEVDGVRTVTAAGAVTASNRDGTILIKKATGAATTVNLASAPLINQTLEVIDGKGDAATNNITIFPSTGSINGAASLVLATNYGGVKLRCVGTDLWSVVARS